MKQGAFGVNIPLIWDVLITQYRENKFHFKLTPYVVININLIINNLLKTIISKIIFPGTIYHIVDDFSQIRRSWTLLVNLVSKKMNDPSFFVAVQRFSLCQGTFNSEAKYVWEGECFQVDRFCWRSKAFWNSIQTVSGYASWVTNSVYSSLLVFPSVFFIKPSVLRCEKMFL